ncbi:SNF2 family N-terminal domain-containing protein [Gaertneriomyces semiglobifer]|nr:SNF2 family N-terminal domain-containing protein [Gaertneriomyces semiglobifer]
MRLGDESATSDEDFEGSELPSSDEEEDVEGDEDAAGDADQDEDATTTTTTTRRPRAPRRGAADAARRQAERAERAQQQIYDNHPELITVWQELEDEIQVIVPELAPQPPDVNVKLLPFQREGLHWLLAQEESRFAGGILADEMGMGKTIQLISLLVSRRMKPNLILTPTVAIMQWYAELSERTTKGLLKVLLFHGTNRPVSREELESYDVVLSTYAIVEQGFRKETYGCMRKGQKVFEPSLIHSINWARVVLDEAHAIKDRSCSTARAVFNLKRQKQWSLSGTPLQNRVGELYSLIRFMNADPFSYYFCKRCPCKMQTWSFSDRRHCDGCGHISHSHFCWWNAEILKPIQKFGAAEQGLVAFKKLGCLLDRIMLRRTKLERTEELGLPPRVVTVRRDLFNEAEEELYQSLYSDSKRTFSTYVTNETVLNNYASIFSLLSRMRLAVNHPDLVTTRVARDAKSAKESLVCGICHEEAEDAILSKCKHVFCREDARQYIQSAPDDDTPTCPVCYKPLTIDLTQPEVLPKSGTSGEGVKSSIVNYIDLAKWRSSSKIEALVEELTGLQRDDHTAKSIVFSQFVAFLDLIQWRLSRAGFSVVKLDGRMAPQQRDTVIKKFMTEPTVTVFLVSLKAGGVALNLTEASRVFVMDPWWNPAVEDQAFDRIHRLGQYRPIKITRMIIENSIESRILQLQEKKKALFQSTVGKDMEALAKLSEDDLRFLFVL